MDVLESNLNRYVNSENMLSDAISTNKSFLEIVFFVLSTIPLVYISALRHVFYNVLVMLYR